MCLRQRAGASELAVGGCGRFRRGKGEVEPEIQRSRKQKWKETWREKWKGLRSKESVWTDDIVSDIAELSCVFQVCKMR